MSAALDYCQSVGETLASNLLGISRNDVPFIKGASEAAQNSPDLGTHDVRKIASQFAAIAYTCANKHDRPEALVFAKMASQTTWDHRMDQWLEPVLKVMGTISEGRQLHKQAAQLGGLAIGSILGKLGSMGLNLVPSAISAAPLAAGALGTGAGAMWWLANKDSEQDSSEVTKVKAKRNYYRALTDEITDELHRKGLVGAQGAEDSSGARSKVVAAMRDSSLYNA